MNKGKNINHNQAASGNRPIGERGRIYFSPNEVEQLVVDRLERRKRRQIGFSPNGMEQLVADRLHAIAVSDQQQRF